MPEWEYFSFEFNDDLPIYSQIVHYLSRAFAKGDIPLGTRIPSIHKMSDIFKVHNNTMQRVYQEMERDGLIEGKRGIGYFFTCDETVLKKTKCYLLKESLRRFVCEMREIGLKNEDILGELAVCMNEKGEY